MCSCGLVDRFRKARFDDCIELYADLLVEGERAIKHRKLINIVLMHRFGEKRYRRIRRRASVISEKLSKWNPHVDL